MLWTDHYTSHNEMIKLAIRLKRKLTLGYGESVLTDASTLDDAASTSGTDSLVSAGPGRVLLVTGTGRRAIPIC